MWLNGPAYVSYPCIALAPPDQRGFFCVPGDGPMPEPRPRMEKAVLVIGGICAALWVVVGLALLVIGR